MEHAAHRYRQTLKKQIGKDPDAGKDWWQEEKGRQRVGQLSDITDTMDMSLSKL